MGIAFKDMKLTPEESKDFLPCAGPCDNGKDPGPMYPWGLNVTLTQRELEKMGVSIDSLETGSTVHLHSLAKVTSKSEDERADGEKTCRVELQLQQLAIESEDAENKEADRVSGRGNIRRLYRARS